MRPLVLGINGSPRKYGNAVKLLMVALEGAKSEGAETKVYHLYDMDIRPCLGCVSDSERLCKYPCVIEDDMRWFYDELLKADALILSTPVYWYGVSGAVKDFIDRLTALENMIYFDGRSWLEGKVAGFIAVGNDVGALATIQNLMAVFNSMGVLIPPWALAYYEGRGDALDSSQSVADAWNIGRIVTIVARTLGKYHIERWYLEDREAVKAVVERVRGMAKELEAKAQERLAMLKRLMLSGHDKAREEL
ncbi:MAG: flavodoxin family protein [Thermoprotei archaeon]|nr:MAG: flavodoxin family protein [Thermoprotei archaeon]